MKDDIKFRLSLAVMGVSVIAFLLIVIAMPLTGNISPKEKQYYHSQEALAQDTPTLKTQRDVFQKLHNLADTAHASTATLKIIYESDCLAGTTTSVVDDDLLLRATCSKEGKIIAVHVTYIDPSNKTQETDVKCDSLDCKWETANVGR